MNCVVKSNTGDKRKDGTEERTSSGWRLGEMRMSSSETRLEGSGADHGRHDLTCWKAWTSSCRQLVTLHSSLGQKFLSSRAKMREKIRLHTFVFLINLNVFNLKPYTFFLRSSSSYFVVKKLFFQNEGGKW